MRLHAVDRAHDEHREIERLQRALHLGGKVDVAGRVEERHVQVFPEVKARLLGEDRDAAPPLQRVVVEQRVAVVHAPQRADRPAAIEHRLGKRRLPGVHMRKDAEGEI